MASEQYSEQLVEIEMKVKKGENTFGFVFPQGDIQGIEKIENLLKKAGGKPELCEVFDFSKGGNGKAKPEYIITFNNDSNTILVVECKRSVNQHASEELNKPKKFAVDGVLYYAKFLKEEYNIVAIAISGTKKEDCKVSTFYWQKGFESYSEFSKINIILEPLNYLKFIKGEKISIDYSIEDIRRTAIDMSNKLRIAKVTANNKPIFIAGILIALQDEVFDAEYQTATRLESLIDRLRIAITKILKATNVEQGRIDSILSAFNDVASLHHFQTTPMTNDNSLRWYIQELDMKIKPMMNYSDSSIDALGEFYQEFIKFSNGDDGKALGIVLTPQHLTDFMCEVSGLNKNSKVVDICAGSGGFLVTAMSKMMKNANPEEVSSIRQHGLYGIEADPNIFALCIANMIVRRDGKSNVHYGSCFDEKIIADLRKQNIDIGLINPPYSQEDYNELAFVEQLLSALTTRGVAVAVVPLNCALGTTCKTERERLFQKHTLEAVFSMPTEIFNPAASAPPCVMVWTANVPHPADKQTFFGYYRNDGFVKRKKLGRVDAYGKWEEIKNEWLKLYRERDVKAGLSVKQCVTHKDEWVAEAYMETDYSKLNQIDFEKKIKEYVAFKFLNNIE
ncbi:MAG: SAM-dependent methyltransferase [Prevotellaceae bacterium]|jgi:type I restriction-modification system DNA methylase subunit|nr:SAM-dependent methyltransferase [Prevotellaceae bacterium]